MTLTEMATKLGLKDSSSLRAAIKRGTLNTDTVGGFHVVSDEEYARYVSTQQHTGRPRKTPKPEGESQS